MKTKIETAYKCAQEQYAKWSIDTDNAIKKLKDIKILFAGLRYMCYS